MGHSSKFHFPLPGRKSKHAPLAPLAPLAPTPITPTGPLKAKAQKILGTAHLAVDSLAVPGWETQSNSGTSATVSDTTNGGRGHGRTHDGRLSSRGLQERRWEQESEIIPAVLNSRADVAGSMMPDGMTDASIELDHHVILRQIQPPARNIAADVELSHGQGAPPSKAQALLDIDGQFTEAPQLKKPKKKPSRLDLSSLLHRHKSANHLRPDSRKTHLFGHDRLPKSPSMLSVGSDQAPPPMPQRTDRALRKTLTKESLRSPSSPHGSLTRPSTGKQQPTKASIDLYHLYDHYEQRTFADAMDQEYQGVDYRLEPPSLPPSYPPPIPGQSAKAYLSPFPNSTPRPLSSKQPLTPSTPEFRLPGDGMPSSVPADCASVSSRHTRTSKASKRTDLSLQEIDLLQNSVLALSSDSEDDYDISSKSSLAVPTLSDGQLSPTSPRSPISQQSTVDSFDGRSKAIFPNTTSSPATAPKITPRTSSLNTNKAVKPAQALVHETSRLSIATTSTARTVSHASQASVPLVSAPRKVPKKASKEAVSESTFDFPAPPSRRGSRSASVSHPSDYPVSPTTIDLYLQSHRSSLAPDNGSIRSGTSLGSAANGRRGSATSSINDTNSGRFMAVTRQEEMLLAALRMKRARMREDIIAEFEDEMDREDNQLRREITNDSMAMSRQSSRSTMRQESGTLSARPRQQSFGKAVIEKKDKLDNTLRITLDRAMYDSTTPGSEISDFIHYDDSFAVPPAIDPERRGSRASSISSQKSGSGTAPGRQRASLSAMTAPAPRRPSRRELPTSRRGSEVSPKGQKDLPHQIPEDPAEDEEAGIPRPDSPISPGDFPVPVSIKNNKQVRLSAVGFYKSDAGW
ncbi:hypothetical protein N0V88_007277 [Collariella sp. IMI 366227]|nr:hypothetical protein N0V88_007277 [Collariella sp. IMI 366227]